MLLCTLLRQRQKPAAWLQMQDALHADFSHLLSTSWLSGRDAGAGVAKPEERAILL